MRLFKILLLFFLSLTSAELLAQVGSTGRPNLDWERDYVCWSPASGADATLVRFTLFVEGQNNGLPVSTKYFDVNNQEVIPNGGSLALGYCKSAPTDTTQYVVQKVEMCEGTTSFIRTYLNLLNESTNQVTNLATFDFDLTGSTYTPSSARIGLCEYETDYEYELICMTDSISEYSRIEFYRLITWVEGVASSTNVDINFQAYTIQGSAKSCNESEIISVQQLCDIDKRNVEFTVAVEHLRGNVVGVTATSATSARIAVTNILIDCGQGEYYNSRLFSACSCDFSDVPDGEYYIRANLDLSNGGSINEKLVQINVIDGLINNIPAGNTISGGTGVYNDVNFITTPFLRYIYRDGAIRNMDLNNNPYNPTGTVEADCANDQLYYTQTFEKSTRPDYEIIGGNECWMRTISGSGNDWTIDNITSLDNLTFNGSNVPLSYLYDFQNTYEQDIFVEDLQNYLVAQNLEFATVTYLEEDIIIKGLDASITAVNATGVFNTISTTAYTGDTTFYYSVYRYASSGKEALSIDHFGYETYLPTDAKKIFCISGNNGGSATINSRCDSIQRVPHVQFYQNTTVTFQANTVYSVDIAPQSPGVVVTMGNDGPTTYPSTYSNYFALPDCRLFDTTIEIDLTASGASAIISWIE